MICREKENPVIRKEYVTPSSPDAEVIGAFNAGVASLGDETILLLRVAETGIQSKDSFILLEYDSEKQKIIPRKYRPDEVENTADPREFRVRGRRRLTSISHLRVAKSRDGVHFQVEPRPFMTPENEYESFGIEDPRITRLEGHYYITYSAISPRGCVVGLAVTDDFKTVRRLGVLACPDNKDTVLFDRKIGGKYYALHRPSSSGFAKPEIWLAESDNTMDFGMHRFVAGVREGKWDSGRVGAGAPPFLTERGWVELYHGATDEDRYCMGAMLLDSNEPWKVLARSDRPLLEPDFPYETRGFFSNVIFGCGLTMDQDTIHLYYGASDECVARVSMTVSDIYHHLGLE